MRLLPMVVALLPMIRDAGTPLWQLLLPAHFTAVSMWVEALRLAPRVPRERRIAFYNGLGTGLDAVAALGDTSSAITSPAGLPPLLGAAMLFLTPMSFLISTLRNARAC